MIEKGKNDEKNKSSDCRGLPDVPADFSPESYNRPNVRGCGTGLRPL